MGNRGLQLIFALALLALVSFSSRGSQKGDSSITKEYQRISKAFEDQRSAYFKAYEKAKTDEERKNLSVSYPDQAKYAEQMLAVAEKDLKDPAAADPLIWVVQQGYYDQKVGPKALQALRDNHITSDKLDQICGRLIYGSKPEDNKAFLNDILEKNPNDKVKASASLALGQMVARSNPEQAEKHFNDVIEKYGTKDQKEAAKGELFEMHNLSIGKVAPDIEGKDIEGKNFKLSDYRGKVVVLDFWGDW
jgi:hypothetical protein